MPGLFGLISIKSGVRLDPEFIHNTIDRMEHKLRHVAQYECERYVDPDSSFAIARIGFPYMNTVEWDNRFTHPNAQLVSFYSGILHESSHNDRRSEFTAVSGPNISEFLCKLKGFFSVAGGDLSSSRIFIAVDRHASRPIYYCVIRDVLYFAPEVKALLEVLNFDKAIDFGAVAAFLKTGCLYGNQTLFNSVRRLKGGEYLLIEQDKLRVNSYWKFKPGSKVDCTDEFALQEELGSRINNAVEVNLSGVSPTVILLSGGIDSRAVLGAALESRQGHENDLNVVTWCTESCGTNSDIGIARKIVEKHGLHHHVYYREAAKYREGLDELLNYY